MTGDLSAAQEAFLKELFELYNRYKRSANVSIMSLGTKDDTYLVLIQFWDEFDKRKGG